MWLKLAELHQLVPMSDKFVKSRLVFNFQGFEPVDSENLLGRVMYCAQKTAQLWGFSSEVESLTHHEKAHFSVCEIKNEGKDWHVDTRIIQLSFGDIIAPYINGSLVGNFARNFIKFSAFFVDGTMFKYGRESRLYAAFILFPIVLIALFSGASYVISSSIFGQMVPSAQLHVLWMFSISIIVFFILCKWPGQRLLFLLTMGLWGYTRDVATSQYQNTEDRCDEFAILISNEIKISEHDEIIFAGHSYGAVWGPMVLSKILDQHPNLLDGRRVAFLSLGGAALMIALIQKATFFRQMIRDLFATKDLYWIDYQSKDDPISFYKANMLDALKLTNTVARYRVLRVNFKHSMALKRYRGMKKSLYNTHRQYGLYQDKCISFDYFLRLLGPIFCDELAEHPSKAKLINPNKDVIVQKN